MHAFTLTIILSSVLVLPARAQSDPVCNSCPSKNCTYEMKLSCYCTGSNRTIEIVSPGDIEYFNVSLGFALDNTGSMGTELLSIKASIQDVVVQTAGLFDKFVIGIFNDPYVSTVIESTDPTAIGTFLAPIFATGGGDCPEMALTGIQDVATRVSPGSIIFVITDASAKDLTLEPAVLALLQSKNIRLNVMATGNLCGGLGQELTNLTSATNGTIYQTLVKTDVDYVMNYIKNFAKYGIRFIRGMPTSLEDLIAIAGGNCSCDTAISNLVCVAPPCPEGYVRVEKKNIVCCHEPCISKLGTLGFVIDNTGSMGAEIAAIKSAISGIIAANTVFTNFVAGQFGDPYVKSVIKSAFGSVIQSFVNAIVAGGGGDCPEYALSGIEDAANLSLHNSVLILFTDASAKDGISKLSAVRALLVSKGIRLIAVISGPLCAPSPYLGEYHDLAAATGGVVVTLTAKKSVKQVLRFVKLVAAGKVSITALPTTPEALQCFKPPVYCWEEVLSTCVCKRYVHHHSADDDDIPRRG